MIRITGGTFRGQKLFSPDDLSVRPAPDMVRVALFNILRDYVPEANVLDLFAGTGALGIESLSRGACFALFVEKEKTNCGIIEKNLNKLSLLSPNKEGKPYALVKNIDALNILSSVSLHGNPFDIIFVDPPYALTEDSGRRKVLRTLLLHLLEPDISSDCSVILFRERKNSFTADEVFAKKIDSVRTYGTTKVSIIEIRRS
ncbi:MAG: 16S rRNA (guanine(966)-N(2))-methyltransferase RsmD [Planctomycetota bacterium]